MKTKFYIFALLLSLKIHFCIAQDERLTPLLSNPVLKNEWIKIRSESNIQTQKIQAVNDTLLLPFLDDFSLPVMFPRSDLWLDSTAFINTDFPVNPPTIGVATFDGLDKFGNPYFATTIADGWCDILTSKPINTYDDGSGNQYLPQDSLFFSFFYEQKGLGDRPEYNNPLDFLRLEFKDSGGFWQVATTINAVGPGSADNTFTRVQISIYNPIYFYNGFQFRFRNYGSLTGNVDHWHVDYVTLKPPPNFSNINDVAYTTPGQSLLVGLTAMPYTHYKYFSNQAALMLNSTDYNIHNNNNSLDKICRFVDVIYNSAHDTLYCNGCPSGSNNFQVTAQNSIIYNFPFASFQYPVYTQDSAVFDVVNHIESTSGGQLDDNAQNDTIHYYQKFINYYAHDDGTAELGYSLNATGAKLAYKFHIYKPDILRAVQFYFTQIGVSVTNELFTIAVWDDNGGVPNNIIFQKPNQTPNYMNVIDGYYTYLTIPFNMSVGDYYFGFIQNNNVQINLGYDANILTPPSNKYYNLNGTWSQSSIIPGGSWMIRPVFSQYPLDVNVNEISSINELSVYPNPASDFIYVDYIFKGKALYELYDATGRRVIADRFLNNAIDVQKITDGFYVLKISDDETKNIFQEKVIIHH